MFEALNALRTSGCDSVCVIRCVLFKLVTWLIRFRTNFRFFCQFSNYLEISYRVTFTQNCDIIRAVIGKQALNRYFLGRSMVEKPNEKFRTVRLLCEQRRDFRTLAGFKKHHRIPTGNTSGDHNFLAELAGPEINQELNKVFGDLRSTYGLKRKQIEVSGPENGMGSILTPYFSYQVFVSLDPENSAEILWQRSVAEIVEPDKIFTPLFDNVFGRQFTLLETDTDLPLNLEAIIDYIEDVESNDIQVDYDKDLTWCRIEIDGSPSSVVVRDTSIRVVGQPETTPAELVSAYATVQQRCLKTLDDSSTRS